MNGQRIIQNKCVKLHSKSNYSYNIVSPCVSCLLKFVLQIPFIYQKYLCFRNAATECSLPPAVLRKRSRVYIRGHPTRRDSTERYNITTSRRRSFHRIYAAVKNPIPQVGRATDWKMNRRARRRWMGRVRGGRRRVFEPHANFLWTTAASRSRADNAQRIQ